MRGRYRHCASAAAADSSKKASLESTTLTVSASVGASYPLSDRLELSAGLFYTPLAITRPPGTEDENDSLFNARALLTYHF